MSSSSSKYMTDFANDVSKVANDRRLRTTVYASCAGIQCTNTHRCCAERRLISLLEHEAKTEGCRGKKIGQYIRKKSNGIIKIWRYTSDGQFGTSFPCLLCRKSIIHYQLKVLCTMAPNVWFEGPLTEETKNISKLTTGQSKYFSGQSSFPLNITVHSK